MAISLARHLMAVLPELRHQSTLKRIRVLLDDAIVADTTEAMLVWEPKRIVPSYAVPERDILAELRPAERAEVPEHEAVGFADGPPVLDPSVPFAVHTAAGESLTVDTSTGRREAAAFRLTDGDLPGYVVVDFDAFDWMEEDEPIVGHARDPFHRIDVRRGSRSVRIEHDGHVLAESSSPRLLFEATFPLARYYLPRQDVQVELRPGTIETTCAYKGHATHYSAVVDGDELVNIAWSYEDPLDDATDVRSMICFYQERLDVFVDGEPVERVRTPWS
jgi:uncharacterized protein (DUF427 family)